MPIQTRESDVFPKRDYDTHPVYEKVKSGEIGGAILLWESPEGLSSPDVHFSLQRDKEVSGDPEADTWITNRELREKYAEAAAHTREVRTPFGDTDDPKVTIHKIGTDEKKVSIEGRLSRYFVLWGLPHKAETVWRRGIEELKQEKETDVPFGNSTHNMLLVKNSESGEPMLVMMAVNAKHGFAAGKLTPTFEHQQNPQLHKNPIDAVIAGFKKELGLDIPEKNIRLHGVAVETRSAYVCTIHIADMSDTLTEQDVIRAWGGKPEWRQGTALLFVPVHQLHSWLTEDIPASVWSKSLQHKRTAAEAENAEGKVELTEGENYKLHHTGPLRIVLLQKYLQSKT